MYRRKRLAFLAWNLKNFSKIHAGKAGSATHGICLAGLATQNRRYAVFLTEHRLFLVFIRKDILTSRFQWVMAWEAAFHREVPHSPPQSDQSGSPEKARHCHWGQNLLSEWKRQCHLFLFLTLIVRIQCKKVTPIITFFQKKERASFPSWKTGSKFRSCLLLSEL